MFDLFPSNGSPMVQRGRCNLLISFSRIQIFWNPETGDRYKGAGYLEKGVITPNFGVIGQFLRGHGYSRFQVPLGFSKQVPKRVGGNSETLGLNIPWTLSNGIPGFHTLKLGAGNQR